MMHDGIGFGRRVCVRFGFVVSGEGFVDVVLGDDLPILADALRDSLGTRPPRGARQDGPSTYWLDSALMRLRARLEDSGVQPFASGNATYLQLRNGAVEARYDYDEVDSDLVNTVAPEEMLGLLETWRAEVLAVSPAADRRMPPPPSARPMPSAT